MSFLAWIDFSLQCTRGTHNSIFDSWDLSSLGRNDPIQTSVIIRLWRAVWTSLRSTGSASSSPIKVSMLSRSL